jgi:cysteine desulfurase
MPVYLDCNATAPMEPRVCDEILRYMTVEYGNAGSRTHEFGARANKAVQTARNQISQVVDAANDEVIFTSGATESNNLAILGLKHHGEKTNRKHIVATAIEHKAVLEPLAHLADQGFDITLVQPTVGGFVEPQAVKAAMRSNTLLVSIMHANNETGVLQPIHEISEELTQYPAYFHVDAAQGFGKELHALTNKRIDLISISSHKIYGPKGIGALVIRRRGYERPPLEPLLFGGGQERGLRSGTLPVHLIAGFGLAAKLAWTEHSQRLKSCRNYRARILQALEPLNPIFNGDQARTLPHVLNISFAGLDSEAVMLALKDQIAISNGSACTSQNYTPSHVLKAMKLKSNVIQGALRISWCHMSEDVDWGMVATTVKRLR